MVICVLLRENGVLKLVSEKVLFTRGGIEQEQSVVEGRDWWLNFEKQWDDMAITGFEDIAYTNEQLLRFEEVKSLTVCENVLGDYVMDGVIGGGLEMLALEKENKELRQLLADLTEAVLLGGAM